MQFSVSLQVYMIYNRTITHTCLDPLYNSCWMSNESGHQALKHIYTYYNILSSSLLREYVRRTRIYHLPTNPGWLLKISTRYNENASAITGISSFPKHMTRCIMWCIMWRSKTNRLLGGVSVYATVQGNKTSLINLYMLKTVHDLHVVFSIEITTHTEGEL